MAGYAIKNLKDADDRAQDNPDFEWDAVRVAPEVVRAFEGGREDLRLIAVGDPSPRAATA